jgi:hypothetical protein
MTATVVPFELFDAERHRRAEARQRDRLASILDGALLHRACEQHWVLVTRRRPPRPSAVVGISAKGSANGTSL